MAPGLVSFVPDYRMMVARNMITSGCALSDDWKLVLCPCSHEIMLDPVLIETGCTFERDALRRWWAQSGVPRCPLTGAEFLPPL